jgi:D-glycero-D-manno-heptose 1,7-bisphosphate phosphatase
MNQQLMELFPLDDILVCPHEEDDHCPCRKPNPGLLIEAGFKWHIDLDRSFVVSDKWQDAQAARVAGCTSIMISSPWSGKGHHDCLVSSFEEGIGQLLKLMKANGVVSA